MKKKQSLKRKLNGSTLKEILSGPTLKQKLKYKKFRE